MLLSLVMVSCAAKGAVKPNGQSAPTPPAPIASAEARREEPGALPSKEPDMEAPLTEEQAQPPADASPAPPAADEAREQAPPPEPGESKEAPQKQTASKETPTKAGLDESGLSQIGALGSEIWGVTGTAKQMAEKIGEKGKELYKTAGEKGMEVVTAAGARGKELAVAAGEKGMALAVAAGEKGKEIIVKAERVVDEQHEWFSGELESTVVLVDRYFDNENTKVEENQTQIKTTISGYYEQDKDIQPGFNLDVKLVLPKFEKKVHILFAGDSEEVGVSASQLERKGSSESQPKPENLPKSAAIRYFLIAVDKQNLSVDGGANLKGLTPVFFGAGRYRLNVDLGAWDMRFTQWAKWFTDTGTALTSRFEFEHLLNEQWLFRGTAEGSWYEQEYGYFYLGRLEAYHTLNPKSVLQYGAVVNFQTWPENRMTNVSVKALHRRNMWRPWFYLEGLVQGSWPELKKYAFVPAAGLKADMLFGRKYRAGNGAK